MNEAIVLSKYAQTMAKWNKRQQIERTQQKMEKRVGMQMNEWLTRSQNKIISF